MNLKPTKAFNKVDCLQGSLHSPNSFNYESKLLLLKSVTTGGSRGTLR